MLFAPRSQQIPQSNNGTVATRYHHFGSVRFNFLAEPTDQRNSALDWVFSIVSLGIEGWGWCELLSTSGVIFHYDRILCTQYSAVPRRYSNVTVHENAGNYVDTSAILMHAYHGCACSPLCNWLVKRYWNTLHIVKSCINIWMKN